MLMSESPDDSPSTKMSDAPLPDHALGNTRTPEAPEDRLRDTLAGEPDQAGRSGHPRLWQIRQGAVRIMGPPAGEVNLKVVEDRVLPFSAVATRCR